MAFGSTGRLFDLRGHAGNRGTATGGPPNDLRGGLPMHAPGGSGALSEKNRWWYGLKQRLVFHGWMELALPIFFDLLYKTSQPFGCFSSNYSILRLNDKVKSHCFIIF